ncbi:MAG: hypothetical protein M3P48_04995 [Actinomycetota bacterium]|nr:hypothetical protein [Actinomycetota bacterium]
MDFDDDLLDEIALLVRVIVAADRHTSPGILDQQDLDVALGVTGVVVDLREDVRLTERSTRPTA